jgi:hypothetical protein
MMRKQYLIEWMRDEVFRVGFKHIFQHPTYKIPRSQSPASLTQVTNGQTMYEKHDEERKHHEVKSSGTPLDYASKDASAKAIISLNHGQVRSQTQRAKKGILDFMEHRAKMSPNFVFNVTRTAPSHDLIQLQQTSHQ